MKAEKAYNWVMAFWKRPLAKVIITVCLVLWISFIFIRSSKPADVSDKESGTFVDATCKTMETITQREVVNRHPVNHRIRKTAHFVEYALLGGISCLFAFVWFKKKISSFIISFLICFDVSCLDELFQKSIEGRSGSFSDVIIDMSGSLTGILLTFISGIAVISIMNKRILKKRNFN